MLRIFKLLASVIVCLAAGLIGIPFNTSSLNDWYLNLEKPFFNPPNWIFAPVWTLLYILMGISLYLIWNKGFKTVKSRHAFYLFAVQLILNAVWSPVFFGLKNPTLALVIIIILFILIDKTIKAFAKIDYNASRLLYPYIAWVAFATVLNFSIVILNR